MYRGQPFQGDLEKCHKQKEIMDLSDLATSPRQPNAAQVTVSKGIRGWSGFVMHSWDALDAIDLRPAGAVTAAFLRLEASDLQSAAKHVSSVPYGRNTHPDYPLIVLSEGHGTCSTKHALLRRLAIEQHLDIALVLGIYEMAEQNTPGVGAVLHKHGLAILPEAHCYLRAAGKRIDVTREIDQVHAEAISRFLHEEDIDPAQITDYKTALHKQFLSKWIAENGGLGGRSLADVWNIREECIASLSK